MRVGASGGGDRGGLRQVGGKQPWEEAEGRAEGRVLQLPHAASHCGANACSPDAPSPPALPSRGPALPAIRPPSLPCPALPAVPARPADPRPPCRPSYSRPFCPPTDHIEQEHCRTARGCLQPCTPSPEPLDLSPLRPPSPGAGLCGRRGASRARAACAGSCCSCAASWPRRRPRTSCRWQRWQIW